MPRAFWAFVVLAACTGAPKQIGSQPSWRHAAVTAPAPPAPPAPAIFAPAGEPVTRYNESIRPPAPSPLGDAVLAAVRDAAAAAGHPVPVADARLSRACAELAAIAPASGFFGQREIEFALHRNGVIEPVQHVLVGWGDLDKPEAIAAQLRPELASVFGEGTVRVGVGAARRQPDGTGAVVFAAQETELTTSPIPRVLPAGGSIPIDAVIDARYHDPEVFVTRDDGTTEQLPLAIAHGGAFQTTFACGAHRGREQVEISATDPSGSTVLANFPVWCAAEPPRTLAITDTGDDGPVQPAEAERRLFALLDRDRRTAGLPALIWDDRVAAVARAHSEEMHATQIVAHNSPTTGAAADRVRAAGIRTEVVLENVARAYGVHEAHAGLMNSPGHRANMMSKVATHVGIGVVLGETVAGKREMYVTQVFIRIPPVIDPARVAELVRSRIAAVRPVGGDPQLTAVAQDLARGLAAGQSRDALWPAAQRRLTTLASAYARVGSVIEAVADVDAIDGKQLVGTSRPDEVGIGIAQGPQPEIGERAIWIVVLMAERPGPAPAP